MVRASGLARPVDDAARMAAMVAGSNLVVTARDASGRLAGVARSFTDFAYGCYLSDLCVDPAGQGRGIGRALVAETHGVIVLLGSGELVRALAAAGLVDEYVLTIVPLVLGSGLRRAGVLCLMLALNYAGWRFYRRSAPSASLPQRVGNEA